MRIPNVSAFPFHFQDKGDITNTNDVRKLFNDIQQSNFHSIFFEVDFK
jgi:hypothetical protein